MSEKIPHIVILGGGFGGLSAATEIRKNLSASQVKITIIDRKDWFMVGFAKLWIIRGTRTFENSIGSLNNLVKKNINFTKAEIQKIDLESKQVGTSCGKFTYDYLIVAMGAKLAPEKILGLNEFGLNLYDHEQLSTIRQKIISLKSGKIAIAITAMPYKCPPAPFEASLLIDSLLRELGTRGSIQIHFYTPAPITLPAAGPEVSEQILQLIKSEQIEFHNSSKIKLVMKNKIEFENTQEDFDLLLAVPPHIAPDVIYDSGLANEGGFITIDRDCRTPYENVYAIGDVTNMPVGEKLAVPKAGVFAEGEGLTVAKNIMADIQSKQENSLFDGKGGCFIESGRDTAALIEVDMFSNNTPTTKLTDTTKSHLDEKLAFEKDRLTNWLS